MGKLTNKIALLVCIFLFFSCKSYNSLVYVLPTDVEKTIYAEVLKMKSKDLFFKIEFFEDEIDVFIIPSDDIKKSSISFLKIDKSNRLVRINDELYYLVFNSDEKYGTEIIQKKLQNIELRDKLIEDGKEDEVQGIKRKFIINDNSLHLKFKNNILIYSNVGDVGNVSN